MTDLLKTGLHSF